VLEACELSASPFSSCFTQGAVYCLLTDPLPESCSVLGNFSLLPHLAYLTCHSVWINVCMVYRLLSFINSPPPLGSK
jgi:hypothetical protein